MRLAVLFVAFTLSCAPPPPARAEPIIHRVWRPKTTPERVLHVVPRHAWDPAPLNAGKPYRGALQDIYRRIVVHHSSFAEPVGPLAIKDYHLTVSGFSDIGYHFVIAPDGTVYEARALSRMGAHAGAVDKRDRDPDLGSIGIVLDGNFVTTAPPRAQTRALALLIDDLRERFPKIERVIGHREVKAFLPEGVSLVSAETTCPGDALFHWLEEQRHGAAFEGRPHPLLKLEVIPKSPMISGLRSAQPEASL
jgi:hypothetical protein